MPKKNHGPSTRTRDLMEVPAVVIPRGATVDEAASIMWEKNIGSVIVVDESGTMAGIVTERDMLFAITKGLTGKGIPVSSITSKTDLIATPLQSIATAVETMRKGGVRHLPVVDKNGKPVGMISMRDALDITGPILGQVLRKISKT
ncbi:MAG: CBS domain-containing protein [Nitrososphaerota archaeon]|nr:CBS domain-containing protein [Nitrososphaerota archaeon]